MSLAQGMSCTQPVSLEEVDTVANRTQGVSCTKEGGATGMIGTCDRQALFISEPPTLPAAAGWRSFSPVARSVGSLATKTLVNGNTWKLSHALDAASRDHSVTFVRADRAFCASTVAPVERITARS